MDYPTELQKAGRQASKLERETDAAIQARDYLIYHAHADGKMSTRKIGPLVGMSHQRAAQIIDRIRKGN